MTAPAAAIFREILHRDVLEALDQAESVHRGLATLTAEQVGLSADEFQRVQGCAEQAYNALAFARTLTDTRVTS